MSGEGGPHRLRLEQLRLQLGVLGLVLDLVGADREQVGGAHGGHAGGAGIRVVPRGPHHVLRVGRQQPLHAPVLAQEALCVQPPADHKFRVYGLSFKVWGLRALSHEKGRGSLDKRVGEWNGSGGGWTGQK